jgi:hypothetical protein
MLGALCRSSASRDSNCSRKFILFSKTDTAPGAAVRLRAVQEYFQNIPAAGRENADARHAAKKHSEPFH